MSSSKNPKRSKSLPKTASRPRIKADASGPSSNLSTPRETPTENEKIVSNKNGGSSTSRSAVSTSSNLYVINEGKSGVNGDTPGIEITDDTNEGYNSRLSMESFDDLDFLSSTKSSAREGGGSGGNSTARKKKVKFSLNGAAWYV